MYVPQMALAKNRMFHDRSKYILTLQEKLITRNKVKMKYVTLKDQIANIFTKYNKLDKYSLFEILKYYRVQAMF